MECKYVPISVVGKGTFGKVSKIRRISDGEVLAWKELYYGGMSEKEKQQLVAEVNILRDLQHPNIVGYYDRIIDRTRKKIFVVMEYCAGGDLASLIRIKYRQRKWIDEVFIWKVLWQTASALQHCHHRKSGKVLHRDLKPGNIFLDDNHNIKLGDFGLARILSNSISFAKTHVGTPYYMSPEQVSESRYNEKSDIWSLGCLTYELACLIPPFRASNQLALAMKIRQGRYDHMPQHYSSDLKRLVGSMLMVDSKKRPTIDVIISSIVVSRRRRKRDSLEKDRRKSSSKRERKKSDQDKLDAVSKQREELRKMAHSLEERERNISLKERELQLRESMIEKKERRLIEKEIALYKLQTKMKDLRVKKRTPLGKENVKPKDWDRRMAERKQKLR